MSSDVVQHHEALGEPLFFKKLPPEIRNNIYRLVLLVNHEFTITKASDSPAEPTILRTNRQIRNEGIMIYYKENEWVFPIVSFDARAYVAWSGKSPWRMAANIRWTCSSARYSYAGPTLGLEQPNWINLMHWLKAYYHGICLGIDTADTKIDDLPRSLCLHFAAYCFAAVREFREDQGLYWPQIESLLEPVHNAKPTDTILRGEAYYMRWMNPVTEKHAVIREESQRSDS